MNALDPLKTMLYHCPACCGALAAPLKQLQQCRRRTPEAGMRFLKTECLKTGRKIAVWMVDLEFSKKNSSNLNDSVKKTSSKLKVVPHKYLLRGFSVCLNTHTHLHMNQVFAVLVIRHQQLDVGGEGSKLLFGEFCLILLFPQDRSRHTANNTCIFLCENNTWDCGQAAPIAMCKCMCLCQHII